MSIDMIALKKQKMKFVKVQETVHVDSHDSAPMNDAHVGYTKRTNTKEMRVVRDAGRPLTPPSPLL